LGGEVCSSIYSFWSAYGEYMLSGMLIEVGSNPANPLRDICLCDTGTRACAIHWRVIIQLEDGS